MEKKQGQKATHRLWLPNGRHIVLWPLDFERIALHNHAVKGKAIGCFLRGTKLEKSKAALDVDLCADDRRAGRRQEVGRHHLRIEVVDQRLLRDAGRDAAHIQAA